MAQVTGSSAWEETSVVSVRLKNSLIKVIDSIVRQGTHKSRGDLIEEAVRDFCERSVKDTFGVSLLTYIERLQAEESK